MIINAAQGALFQPLTFSRYASNPVIAKGAGGTWEDVDVANPDVFYDTPNSRWVMNYSGYDGAEWHTGLAYSTDLLNWTKEASNPVFSPNEAEGYIAANGSIVLKGSTYYLYYQLEAATDILLATSPDLLDWTRIGSVLAKGAGGEFDDVQVFDPSARLLGDGTIELFYAANDGSVRSYGRATSSDGATFVKSGKLFTRPLFATAQSPGEPYAYRSGENYILTYDCAESNGVRYISQAFTLDGGVSWKFRQKILDKGAAEQWDSAQVFDSCMVQSGSTLYLFYAGATATGVAENLSAQVGVATVLWV